MQSNLSPPLPKRKTRHFETRSGLHGEIGDAEAKKCLAAEDRKDDDFE
jgi:hypothetical protein